SEEGKPVIVLAKFRGLVVVAVALAMAGCSTHSESVAVVKGRGNIDLGSYQCQNHTQSNFITRICYETGTRRLLLEFEDGTYKQFCNVDVSVANGLVSTDVKGEFYGTRIRDAGHECGAVGVKKGKR